jgi:uncharacterized protein
MEKLTAEEARVLGCLVEKQMTTPEYYPMTVNALVTACNQKTSRHPVVTYDDEIVERALSDLTDRGLTRFTRTAGARTLKYVHKAGDVLQIDDHQVALVAVLLLRGAQTPGELRTRTDRYVEFRDVSAVEEVLDDLMTRDVPLVERLERVPGQKESRYRTLLVEPVAAETAETPARPPRDDARTAGLEERIAHLEERLARIESELGLAGGSPSAG